jgi:hypothetical protein
MNNNVAAAILTLTSAIRYSREIHYGSSSETSFNITSEFEKWLEFLRSNSNLSED